MTFVPRSKLDKKKLEGIRPPAERKLGCGHTAEEAVATLNGRYLCCGKWQRARRA